MPAILYVEDNDDNIFMLKGRLRKKGFDVAIAGNGQEALDVMKASLPDLILMDLGLPVMDGWEATKRAKSDPVTRDIPIIVLTAHAMEGEKERALGAGADDFDTKPVNFRRLLSKIEALLGRE